MGSRYIPRDIIQDHYKQADRLSNQKWAPSWAGVLAAGLGGVGGNVYRGAARGALKGNQGLRSGALRDAANADDNASMSKILLDSSVPGLDEMGLKTTINSRNKQSDRAYAQQIDQMKYDREAPMRDARLDLLQAQTARAGRGPAAPADVQEYQFAKQNGFDGTYMDWKQQGGGGATQGKLLGIFQDKNGNFFSAQGNTRGRPSIYPLTASGGDLTPAKGFETVGDTRVNKATDQVVRNIGGDIAGAEIAKGEGQNVAKIRAGLPAANQRLKLVTGGLDRLLETANDLQKSKGLGRVSGGLYQAYAPNFSEKARNAGALLENLKVKISGTVLQAMRDASKTGGAVGQVTEKEWPRLENMIASLDPAQGDVQFAKQLAIVKTYAEDVKTALVEAYKQDLKRAGVNNQDITSAVDQDQPKAPPSLPPGYSMQRVK